MLPQDGIVEADEHITMSSTANWNVQGAGKLIWLSVLTLFIEEAFKKIDDGRQLCEAVRAIMQGRHRKCVNRDGSKHSNFFFSWRYNPMWVCILQPSSGAIAFSPARFLDHTQLRATVGRTSLDEWSVRRRDLYLTTHNTHNRQTSMPPVGFEPTIAAGEKHSK